MDRETYEKDLAERQRQHLEKVRKPPNWQPCMHDSCQECHGTSVRRDGTACLHMISCPCPKCSPLNMMITPAIAKEWLNNESSHEFKDSMAEMYKRDLLNHDWNGNVDSEIM